MPISKVRKISAWVLTAIPIFLLTAACLGKLTANEEVVQNLAPYNINPQLLGIVLLGCLLLYLIPKTSNIGFFLLCSYMGGVIVGELVKGDPPIMGIVLSILLYVGTMLRKPELSGLGI